ncbi:MAG: replicative DNA helicase [Chloroflexi bacterium]|nr:replicative DNA helicase [Chloroflexota bacterium]
MYAEKLPPHDVEAEESVIGSLLIDGEAINRVAAIVKPDDFYRERNRWCYESCLALYQRNEAINQVTLSHELGRRERLEELGGPAYLSHLVTTVPTSIHIEHYARIVSRTATMRRLIQTAGEIATIGYDNSADVDSAMAQAEDLLFRIRTGQGVRDFASLREILDKYLEDSASIIGGMDTGMAPIHTDFPAMDELLMGGLQRSDLIILAARPSIGKSTLAMNIARNAAGQGAVVGVFSLEMSREQLALRLLSAEAEVENHRLRVGLVSDAEASRVGASVGALSDLSIYIDDTPLQTVLEIRSKSRRLHMERGLDLVVVDYLQLIRGASDRMENRVLELGEITRQLKGMARDLNIPVLTVSQLSRAPEQRPDHRPQLSDLRESGSIEQDADVVSFIYREDRYRTEEDWEQRYPTEPYPRNIVEFIVAKHRHGPVDTINLYFRGNLSRFESLAAQQWD